MLFAIGIRALTSGSLILVAAAVIPAVLLVTFIYKKDRLEKESPAIIKKLLLRGIISTFLASMCESLGSGILSIFFSNENNVVYRILLYFVVVGFSEEVSKYVILSRATWNSPEFNCKYDAVVYAATVSLGFALWENIKYVLAYGFQTALLRAVTAVPGHACFGVLMGLWYGMAKRFEIRGDTESLEKCKKLAVLMPAFVHGCYDYIATSGSAEWVFVVFVLIMFIISYLMVKRLSSHDSYL